MRLAENKARGFTLIEMAIVLVIIGIILAGVMKGRDIVRGAQVKQFSQQFAQKWVTVAQTYYDKTGQLLFDGTVNGAAAGVISDGQMDGSISASIDTVVPVLQGVGIDPCTMIKSKMTAPSTTAPATGAVVANHCSGAAGVNIVQTIVEGEYAGSQIVTADLNTLAITYGAAAGAITAQRNVVILYNVPTDVARGLDTAIDGRDNGIDGSCLNIADIAIAAIGVDSGAAYAPGAAVASIAWPLASAGGTQTVLIVMDY